MEIRIVVMIGSSDNNPTAVISDYNLMLLFQKETSRRGVCKIIEIKSFQNDEKIRDEQKQKMRGVKLSSRMFLVGITGVAIMVSR